MIKKEKILIQIYLEYHKILIQIKILINHILKIIQYMVKI